MWRRSNAARGGAAAPLARVTAWVTAILLVLAAAPPAAAQDAPAAPAPGPQAAPAPTLDAPLLDGSHARQAHRLAVDWVRQGAVAEPLPAEIPVTDLFAVRVTLRIHGYTVGIGDAARADAAAAVDAIGPPVGLVGLVADATRAALTELEKQLKGVRMRAVIEGRTDSSRPAPTPADVGDRVLVGVQLARHPVTIRIPIDAPPSAVFGTFAGGFHGLRAVSGGSGDAAADHAAAMIWPASALAANTAPDGQLVQLLHRAGYRHDQVLQLGRPVEGAPAFQRFEVIHIVRPRPGLPVMQLVRGNILLPPLSVSSHTLRSLGDQLAEHLAARFIDGGGVRGAYHPTPDRYDPLYAGDEDIGIACYALTRHSRWMRRANPESLIALHQGRLALDTAVHLARSGLDRADGPGLSPAAGAYVLLTLADADLADARHPDLRDRITRWLLSLRDDRGRLRVGAGEDAQPLNETRAAVVTAALAAVYQQTRDPSLGAAVTALLDQLWSAAQSNPNPAALPWIVIAQTRAQRFLADGDAQATQTLHQRQRVLGDLVDRLGRQQVIEPPLLGPPDVIGGFQFYPGAPGSPPNPDWRSAHLLSFLALCLADDAIAQGHNRFDWALTAGLAARFIGQLMIDEPACYYMRNPEEALGGVRLALWNNDLAIAPTAISLLAVTQLQEATQSLRPAVETPDKSP